MEVRGLFVWFFFATAAWAQDRPPDDDRKQAEAVDDPVLQRKIQDAIARGVDYLKSTQEKSGAWSYSSGQANQYPGGMTALCVYALAASGVKSDDPAIRKAIEWMFSHGREYARGSSHATYSASLLVLALARVDAKQHAEAIRRLAARIAEGQLARGSWNYRLAGSEGGDLSNAQFAILALWAAQTKAGARIEERVWKRVHRGLTGSQLADGGWSYGFNATHPTPSMTAAGLFGLVVSEAALAGGPAKLADARASDRARRGARKLLAKPLPYEGYYYCYGLERAAAVMDLPPAEWYVDGARNLVGRQRKDGAWSPDIRGGRSRASGPDNYQTALALLFLARATGTMLKPGKPPVTPGPAQFPETVTAQNLKRAFEAYLLADEDERKAWTPKFGAAGPATVALLVERLGDPQAQVRAAAYDLLRALLEKRLLFDVHAEETDRAIMLGSIEAWFRKNGPALRWDESTGRFR